MALQPHTGGYPVTSTGSDTEPAGSVPSREELAWAAGAGDRAALDAQRREMQRAAQWLDADHRDLLAGWWLEASGRLSRAELAEALQADPHRAAVQVGRMKEQLETARRLVRALALTPRCPGLAEAGAGWRGETDPVWRKRFARHLRECVFCDSTGSGLIPPERLLAGLARLPLPAAYAAFRVAEADTTVAAAVAGAVAGAAAGNEDGSGRHRGSHRAGDAGRGGAKSPGGLLRRPILVAAAAVGILAVAAAAVVGLQPGRRNAAVSGGPTVAVIAPSAQLSSSSTAAISASSAAPGVSTGSATATATATATKAASASASGPAHPAPPPSSATSAASAASSTAAGTDTDSNSSDAADQVLAVINDAREQAGLSPYTMSDDLIDSATAHDTRMEDGCGLSHQCPGEPALGDRETAAGVQWTAAGENIGDGGPVAGTQAAIAQMAVGLTNSMLAEQPPNDGHRLNILSSGFTEVGIAVTRDSSGTVWMTQDFAN